MHTVVPQTDLSFKTISLQRLRFATILRHRKEIRNNDRNFQTGDSVILNEWDGENYTGRFCVGIIIDIYDISFLLPDYVAFTFKLLGEYEEITK